MIVGDPTAAAGLEARDLRLTLDELDGKTVGFIDNAKPNFNFLVDDLAELLVTHYGAGSVVKFRKRGASIPAPHTMIEDAAKQCDVIITGSGD